MPRCQPTENGRKLPVGDAERQVHAELRALAKERKTLLEQVAERQAVLRAKQGEFDRARAAAARTGRKGKNAHSVSRAERKARMELAVLASERAHLDGTAQRDREFAKTMDAIYESCHDPVALGQGDW